jgi:hypothetical protein
MCEFSVVCNDFASFCELLGCNLVFSTVMMF